MDNSLKMIVMGMMGVIVLIIILVSCSRSRSRDGRRNPNKNVHWYDNCPSCVNEQNQGYKAVRSTYVDEDNKGYKPVRSGYIQWPPLKGDTKFGNPPGKIFPMEDTNLLNRNYDNLVESDGYNTVGNSYFDIADMNDTYMFTPRAYKYYLQNKEGI